jgi:hypothetical protein
MRPFKVLFPVVLVLLLGSVAAAQTAAANVSGIVTDPSQAVVAGAALELTNAATNYTYKTTTNSSGAYIFTGVQPGIYKLTVSASGFRNANVPSVKLEVAKSHTLNVQMEVGTASETVEVVAAAVQLESTDARVGTAVGGIELQRLPTIDRSAASLVLLQPLVVGGGRNVDDVSGGQVAGSRSDQQTFLLDGGDATNDTEGSGGYAIAFEGFGRPAIPVPVESVEEFRVTTTNPDATFGRAAGAAVSLVTKRGTNNIHGSAYWYHQNDNLNANTWDLNRAGIRKPELKDNRYGFSAGGPIWKDRTFIYGHYEGRLFPQSATITRIVPTDTMKAGTLQFRDGTGAIISYPLASAICSGGGACDPRGLGISPIVSQFLALYPTGNDTSLGDGLNTIGYRATVPFALKQDFAVARLDHMITNNWNFFSSYRYHRHLQPGLNQVDITPGNGLATSVASNPVQPRYLVAGVDGQITPRLSGQFRFSWTRNWWEWIRFQPAPQVAGLGGALDLGGDGQNATGTFLAEPINVDTQQARSRIWHGKDYYIAGNFAWLKGPHTFQFGGNFRRWNIFHRRNDKVLGAVDALIYFSRPDTVSLSSTNRPTICPSNTTGTNCLRPGDQSIWDMHYVNTLGIIDRATILLTRDAVNLDPLPPGTPLTARPRVDAYEGFFQDTWRVNQSFTVTAGVNYALQLPPKEAEDKQMVLIFRDSQQPVIVADYLEAARRAAENGTAFNPEFAWTPLRASGRTRIMDVDTNNFGPRIAAAWNPNFDGGFLGALFGQKKTVLRGGYSLTYDRVNGVGLVMTPLLGVGLGQILQCLSPNSAGTCTNLNQNPGNAFRIGVDGNSVPVPAATPGTVPFTVPLAGESSSRLVDPGREVAMNHSLNFTWQREVQRSTILEIGYVGKFGRKLLQNIDLNSVPLTFRDPTSGQTFAEAFDAVAQHLRAGGSTAALATQPWFENLLTMPVTSPFSATCGAFGTFTQRMACQWATDFRNGNAIAIAGTRISANRLWAGNPLGFVNWQSTTNQLTSSTGRSWYNAAFVSLRRRPVGGLSFGVNYTLAKSMDDFGLNQQYVNSPANSLYSDIGINRSTFDRRHTLTSYGLYELPFGRGRRWGTDSGALDRLIGGWDISWVFEAMSGLPLCVTHGGNWGASGGTFNTACAIGPKDVLSRNDDVAGSGGIGTNGTVNGFADPEAVFGQFRQQLISSDERTGFGYLTGQGRWDFHTSVAKRIDITERIRMGVHIDFINVFNHTELDDPSSLSLTSPANFGVISSQYNSPRTIQLGLRVDF